MSGNHRGGTTDDSAFWPRRLAQVMVLLVWPLIWVGSLVTTYDAGMSVPDWPGTYGYNLFLYPISTWILGPFDLFIEHGHRLLAALVGVIAIGFLVASWWQESRRWVTGLAAVVLAAVIGQGVLGGLRVTMSERTLAMIHGCVAPACFALCVVAACVTSRRWNRDRVIDSAGNRARTPRSGWALALIVVSYMQLMLGALLRHAPPTLSPTGFGHVVTTHVTLAFALWVLTGAVAWRSYRCGDLTLSRPAFSLICLVAVQILLGVGTWLVNYGYPPLLQELPGSGDYLLQAKAFRSSLVVTSHVAVGALILAVSTWMWVRWRRRNFVLRDATKPGVSAERLPTG